MNQHKLNQVETEVPHGIGDQGGPYVEPTLFPRTLIQYIDSLTYRYTYMYNVYVYDTDMHNV